MCCVLFVGDWSASGHLCGDDQVLLTLQLAYGAQAQSSFCAVPVLRGVLYLLQGTQSYNLTSQPSLHSPAGETFYKNIY